jgi:integrase/recombinase XerD
MAQKPKPMRKQRTALEHSIRDYLDDVTARRRRPKTLHYYRAVLTGEGKRPAPKPGGFLGFCLAEGVTDLKGVDQKLVNLWTTDLNNRNALASPGVQSRTGRLSVDTVNSYTRTVNQFLRWAHGAGVTKRLVEAHQPTLSRKLREVLTDDDFKRLMEAATEADKSARDPLILRVLWQTGMRASELCKLHVSDLEDDGNRRCFIKVQAAKSGDERKIQIKPALYKDLKQYAAKRGKDRRGRDELWLGLRRDVETGEYQPLTPSGLGQLLQAIASDAEVTKPTNPHSFRHSFITRMVLKNVNMVLLQQVVGHRSPAMIHAYYAHVTASDAGKALMDALRDED